MSKAEILNLINNNRNCFLATVENNIPHVRGITIYGVDEKGIVIQTWKIKDIYPQIVKNPAVEMCFNDFKAGIQVRVSGKMEEIEGLDYKKKVVADRPFMQPIVASKGYDVVALFRLKGKATVWTRDANFDPKTYVEL